MKYKNLFFDLDDTIWAFSRNARDTFEEVYRKYSFERYFDSFDHYYTIYQQRNTELWIEYGEGKITKDELNWQRFSYPLQAVGVEDETLAEKFSEDFFAIIPTKHFRVKIDFSHIIILGAQYTTVSQHISVRCLMLNAT